MECSGVFELKLKQFRNPSGRDNQGNCCSGRQDALTGKCIGQCKTRFRVCLKHYQAKIDTTSPCTFGDVSTPVLGENTIDLALHPFMQQNYPYNTSVSINPIQFPFDFTWPVSRILYRPFNLCYSPMIPANDNNDHTTPSQVPNIEISNNRRIIIIISRL